MLSETVASSSIASSDPTPHDREMQITAYAIDCLYRTWPGTMLSLILSAIVMGALVWQRVSHLLIVCWVITVTVLKFTNYVLIRSYRRRQSAPHDARRWANYFTFTALLMGLTWGAIGIIFFVPDSLALQLLLF